MSEGCPLPIDWLDFLDTGGSNLQKAHLVGCRSCSQLIELLKSQPDPQDSGSDWGSVESISLSRPNGDKPRIGQVWLTHRLFDRQGVRYQLPRNVLLVVATEPIRARDEWWFHGVPLATDVESATDTDLVIEANGSSLSARFRAVVPLVKRVAASQCQGVAGQLTEEAVSWLAEGLGRTVPTLHAGAPLEGSDDPRLWANEELAEIVGILAGYRWHLREHAALADPVAYGESNVVIGSFKRISIAADEPVRRLAAKTAMGDDIRRYRLEASATRFIVVTISHELWDGDFLRVRIDSAAGFDHPVKVVAHSERGTHSTEPFDPMPGLQLKLAPGHGLELLRADRWELWQLPRTSQ